MDDHSDIADVLRTCLSERQRTFPTPEVSLWSDDRSWRRASDCLNDDAFVAAFLDYQRSFTPDLDDKGQGAYAIGEYAQMLASATVPLLVGFRIVPDFRPDACAIGYDLQLVEHAGRTLDTRNWRIAIPSSPLHVEAESGNEGSLVAGESAIPVGFPTLCERFRKAVEAHCAPLIETVHRQTKLGRKALWRLVGDSFSQVFLDAGRTYDCPERACSAALLVLKAPGSPLTNRQMHFFDIAVHDDRDPPREIMSMTFRARGGCCRYYTVQGGHLCTTCVLQDPAVRDLKIETHLRSRLGLAPPRAIARASSRV
jgi:hypothetical protein